VPHVNKIYCKILLEQTRANSLIYSRSCPLQSTVVKNSRCLVFCVGSHVHRLIRTLFLFPDAPLLLLCTGNVELCLLLCWCCIWRISPIWKPRNGLFMMILCSHILYAFLLDNCCYIVICTTDALKDLYFVKLQKLFWFGNMQVQIFTNRYIMIYFWTTKYTPQC